MCRQNLNIQCSFSPIQKSFPLFWCFRWNSHATELNCKLVVFSAENCYGIKRKLRYMSIEWTEECLTNLTQVSLAKDDSKLQWILCWFCHFALCSLLQKGKRTQLALNISIWLRSWIAWATVEKYQVQIAHFSTYCSYRPDTGWKSR